jgi:hypothetical protein
LSGSAAPSLAEPSFSGFSFRLSFHSLISPSFCPGSFSFAFESPHCLYT